MCWNLLDYREVESTADRLVLEMDNRPDLANVRGALQGGLVATLIDIAAGMLAGNASGVGYDVTTADLNIHFLAPIMGDGPRRGEGGAGRQTPHRDVGRCHRHHPRSAGRPSDADVRGARAGRAPRADTAGSGPAQRQLPVPARPTDIHRTAHHFAGEDDVRGAVGQARRGGDRRRCPRSPRRHRSTHWPLRAAGSPRTRISCPAR